MKKVLLFIASSAILVTIGCKPSKDDVRKAFITKCNTSIPPTVPKDVATEYCNCSADALLNKYSVDEIAEMEKKITAGDARVKNKMMQDIAPCMETLAQKARNQKP